MKIRRGSRSLDRGRLPRGAWRRSGACPRLSPRPEAWNSAWRRRAVLVGRPRFLRCYVVLSLKASAADGIEPVEDGQDERPTRQLRRARTGRWHPARNPARGLALAIRTIPCGRYVCWRVGDHDVRTSCPGLESGNQGHANGRGVHERSPRPELSNGAGDPFHPSN